MTDDNLEHPTLAATLAGETEQSAAETGNTTEQEVGPADAETAAGTEQTPADENDELDENNEEDDSRHKRRPAGSARLKAQLAEARAELERLRSFVPDTKASTEGFDKAIEAELGPRPKESDYKDYLEYERAANAYETAKLLRRADFTREAQRIEASRVEQARLVVEAHKEREAEVRKAIPDYDAVIRAANFPVAKHIEALIIESDKSAQVAYYLAKRPNLVSELNGLPEREAARRIGRIEASVSLPKPAQQTKAPAPVRSLGSGASQQKDPAKMSMKEFDAWFEKTYPNM